MPCGKKKSSAMNPTIEEVRRIGDARQGLQDILYCLLILWAIAAVPLVIHADSLPTVPCWPWLGDFVAAILPGLPPRLAQVAATYPLQTLALLGLAWLLRRGMARLADAQSELILQRSIGNDAYRMLRRAKFAAFVAKLRWPAILLLLAILSTVSLDVLADVKPECERPKELAQGLAAVGCSNVRGTCRMAEGECVRITIRSDRDNGTGILLEAGAIYTLRFLESSRWTDNGRCSPARGFHFERNAIGIPRFWWAEWMRPLSEGRWFQLVGRVDNEKPAFPVLGDNPCLPYAWAPQRSGELVLLVNDFILGNNTGSMTLELARIRAPTGGFRARCDSRHAWPGASRW